MICKLIRLLVFLLEHVPFLSFPLTTLKKLIGFYLETNKTLLTSKCEQKHMLTDKAGLHPWTFSCLQEKEKSGFHFDAFLGPEKFPRFFFFFYFRSLHTSFCKSCTRLKLCNGHNEHSGRVHSRHKRAVYWSLPSSVGTSSELKMSAPLL